MNESCYNGTYQSHMWPRTNPKAIFLGMHKLVRSSPLYVIALMWPLVYLWLWFLHEEAECLQPLVEQSSVMKPTPSIMPWVLLFRVGNNSRANVIRNRATITHRLKTPPSQRRVGIGLTAKPSVSHHTLHHTPVKSSDNGPREDGDELLPPTSKRLIPSLCYSVGAPFNPNPKGDNNENITEGN